MPRFRYILFLMITVVVCYPLLFSNSFLNAADKDSPLTLSIEDSILQRYKQKLLESYQYYRKQIGLDETEAPASIQHFPVIVDESYHRISTQQFYTERYFSRLYTAAAIVEVQQTIDDKQNDNVISISNLPVNRGYLSSRFGMRKDPIHGGRQMHKGIDIAARYGSTVNPLGKGTVVYAGYKAGYGNTVEIKHGNTVLTRYAHLKTFLVDIGQQVSVDDEIGLVGSSGRSTGPHLHLEVLFNDKQVDPQIYLANHFGSGKYQFAQATQAKTKKIREQKNSNITATDSTVDKNIDNNKVASVKHAEVSEFPQVSYRDIVNSVNGLYGFTAPSSFR